MTIQRQARKIAMIQQSIVADPARGLLIEQSALFENQTESEESSNDPFNPSLQRREDFGHFLNRLGLIGEAAEIGVASGHFSRILLKSWHGRILHLVDAWRHLNNYVDACNPADARHQAFFVETQQNVAPFPGRYQFHRMLSQEAAERFKDESLDFIYIDADHSYHAVCQDLRAWYPKVRRGGILAGHDFFDGNYSFGRFGVASAVCAFQQELDLEVFLTHDPPARSWYLFRPVN